MAQQDGLSDDELMTDTQRRAFEYFWTGAEPNSGWARERIHLDEPDLDATLVTSGGTGFGIMAILVGVERNFVTREAAVEQLEKIFDFAERADRYHGIWPHWLIGDTGKVKPFSPMTMARIWWNHRFLRKGLSAFVSTLQRETPEKKNSLSELTPCGEKWTGIFFEDQTAKTYCSGIGHREWVGK